jgi:hypothetical protein
MTFAAGVAVVGSTPSSNAPIALFAYCRPAHTRQTVSALKKNGLAAESDLFVFSDAAKDSTVAAAVQEVRSYLRTIDGFRSVSIVERATNMGLANSIIGGVTSVCAAHDRVIVMEDDLVTSSGFLRFMNEALNLYRDDEAVASVHGYWYPIEEEMPETFLLRGASCWGWATWGRAWRLFEPDGSKLLKELRRQELTELFDLEGAKPYTSMLENQVRGKSDSWAIRWHAATFLANRLQLSPHRSLVNNIGFDWTGTNCSDDEAFAVSVAKDPPSVRRIVLEENAHARAALIRYFRRTRRSLAARAISRLRRVAMSMSAGRNS